MTELTRRNLLAIFVRPLRSAASERQGQPRDIIALVHGRQCLALISFCSACVERCPVEGAMKVIQGMPMVVPEACTGCGVCHQVCPAPEKAISFRRRPLAQKQAHYTTCL